MDDCLTVLEEAFREEALGRAVNRTKALIHIPTSDPDTWYSYASMEGGIEKFGVAATRIRSHIHSVHNVYGQRRNDKYCGLPGKYGGFVLLFSSKDGSLLAILNDGHIQHLRVGATSGISAKYMARKDASILGIIGSGGMATTHAWAMSRVRELKLIKVYSPNFDHRTRFAQQMSRDLGVEVRPMNDPKSTVVGSDIVCACTSADEPVILASWLQPGMHVTIVSTSGVELNEDSYARFDRYVTYRSDIAEHHFTTPDWRPPHLGGTSARWKKLEEDIIGRGKIASLPQVILGRSIGRANDAEITCLTSEGTGVQFAAISYLAHQRAKQKGVGRRLPADWFLQDIRS
jgi:ornithine cyclodeaminase/alanine dehydrogenase-like protein (mu-crystallin family)